MNDFDYFILSLFAHGYKVRFATLYFLLVGKRTSSILIYGLFTRNLSFFGIFPHLRQSDLTKSINKLSAAKLMEAMDQKRVVITDGGQELLQQKKGNSRSCPDINGERYGRSDQSFWSDIVFVSQIISELAHQEKRYVPLEANAFKQKQMKHWLIAQKYNRRELSQNFFQEWGKILTDLSEKESLLLTNQLSGHEVNGKTWEQIMDVLDEAPGQLSAYLFWKNTLHHFIGQVETLSGVCPIFYHFLSNYHSQMSNSSMEATWKLFRAGNSLEKVGEQRRLKRSTITDHLLESAVLRADFPFDQILLKEERTQLDQIALLKNEPVEEWDHKEIMRETQLDFRAVRFYQIESVKVRSK